MGTWEVLRACCHACLGSKLGRPGCCGARRRQGGKPAHLKPGRELLQLRDGARGAAVDVAGLQAGLVVGKDGERLADSLGGQLLAPPLAGAPVPHLARPVDLHPSALQQVSDVDITDPSCSTASTVA